MRTSLILSAALLLLSSTPAAAQKKDLEVQLGEQTFAQLRDQVEIIQGSPLYAALQPLQKILRVAQPRYKYPMKFILVHEAQPNDFATPGGNIYVTDSLLYFARNQDELAGTLCHETAHLVHQDPMNKARENERIAAVGLGAILLHPSLGQAIVVKMLADLRSNTYSRGIESAADVTGSDICAAAGYNPYGLVWLFQDFKNADTSHLPAFLSDHPSDDARIHTLLGHFRQNPAVFGKFSADRKQAKPYVAPKNAPVIFLRK
jgi:predicted Zn-dependent protease